MNCPDPESLIAFAVSPPVPENDGIAAHVFACARCRRIAADAGRGLRASADVSDVSLPEVRKVIRGRMSGTHDSLWAGLIAKVTALISRETPLAPPAGAPVFTFAAREKAAGDDGAGIEITFAADVEKDSGGYWEATLRIPAGVSDFTLLSIAVTDDRRAPVPGGRLSLLGKTLFVFNGTAQISFGDFRKGLKETRVSYIDVHGHEVAGDLIIC